MTTIEMDLCKQIKRLKTLKQNLDYMYEELDAIFRKLGHDYKDLECQTYHCNAYDIVRLMLAELELEEVKQDVQEDLRWEQWQKKI